MLVYASCLQSTLCKVFLYEAELCEVALTCHSSLDVICFLSGLSAGAFCVSSWTGDRDSTAKRLGGLRLCQQSLLGRLSSNEEDDIISDGG